KLARADIKQIAKLTTLDYLDISQNLDITNDDLKLLLPLTGLTTLNIANTAIDRESIQTLRQFPSLKFIWIDHKHWSNDDLTELKAALPKLHIAWNSTIVDDPARHPNNTTSLPFAP